MRLSSAQRGTLLRISGIGQHAVSSYDCEAPKHTKKDLLMNFSSISASLG